MTDASQGAGPSFEDVANAALSACPGLLQRWLPNGHVEGREFVVGDVAGNPGDSCKVNVDTGKWADFAADQQGGDLISLYAAVHGYDNMGRACRDLAEELGVAQPRTNGHDHQAAGERRKIDWTPQHPVLADAPEPGFRHYKHGAPSATWTYRGPDGHLIGYVCRFDKGDGKKEIVPLSYCAGDSGERGWRWLSFAKPRPLYGLDRLAAAPAANVIVVEGEKAADAAQRLFPSQVVVTWPGGSKAIRQVDWSPLEGRKAVLWPDADKPGRQCMDGWVDDHGVWKNGIAQMLADRAAGVRVVDPPADVKEGWDAADLEADGCDEPTAWLKARMRAPTDPPVEPPADDSPLPDPADYGAEERSSATHGDGVFATAPFRVLGYNRDVFYYYPYNSAQIIELPTSRHRKESLLRLCGLSWWERHFMAQRGVDWTMAADALFRTAEAKGVFHPSKRRRGRGIWFDDGRAVFNLGDRLLVDGEACEFRDLDTRFVYEAGEPLASDAGQPLRARDASHLLDICLDLKWERGISAYLLAGWIMIAPLSGALAWRPHIWITGPAHSGKTTVVDDVVGRCLREIAFTFEGKSTESAMRQRLEYDALPIIFDEPEQQDERSRTRVQDVIDFARIASSGGFIYKGTQTQTGAKAFLARSAVCMSSIHVGVQHYQDETRFTPLVLTPILARDEEEKAANDAHYRELMRKINETLTPEFVNGLMMRSVRLLPTILKNAETFTRAVASYLGNRRIGDQLGAMLAGAYALRKSREVTFDEALEWIRDKEWSEHAPIDTAKNEEKLLQTILQHPTRISTGNGGMQDRTLGDLVDAARDKDQQVPRDVAETALKRHGIRYEPPDLYSTRLEGITISTSHSMLQRILKDTPWGTQWRGPLLNIDGAERSPNVVRFGPGAVTRAVFIPVQAFDSG